MNATDDRGHPADCDCGCGAELLSLTRASRLSGWEVNQLRIWVGSGQLPTVMAPSGLRRIRRADLLRFRPPEPGLSVSQAARALGVDEQEVRYQIRKGVIPARRSAGGHFRIDPGVVASLDLPPRRRRASRRRGDTGCDAISACS